MKKYIDLHNQFSVKNIILLLKLRL